MSNRPAILCFLQKGKLLDTHDNVVDTFNWLVSFIENLTAEDGIEIADKNTGSPILRLTGKGSSPVDISALDGLTVVTNVSWDTATHSIKIEKSSLSVSDGTLTVSPISPASYISTTPLTSVTL